MPFQHEFGDAKQPADRTIGAAMLATSARGTMVAIPAYNEELTIGSVVARARRYADRVVVVDDGSDDGTCRCS